MENSNKVGGGVNTDLMEEMQKKYNIYNCSNMAQESYLQVTFVHNITIHNA